MIIFANRKARKPAGCGRSGSPSGWRPIGPTRSWKSAAATAGCSASFEAASTSRWRASISARRSSGRRVGSCPAHRRLALILGRGERLPFADQSFDMVVTSAVILHNPPAAAEAIRREVMRVARRFAAHNEETDVSYNRYGYDTAAWYRAQGIALAESGPIPMDPDPGGIAVLRRGSRPPVGDRAALSPFLSTRRRTP